MSDIGDVKIIRESDSQALFDHIKPYLDQGWQMTVFGEDWAILIKETV